MDDFYPKIISSSENYPIRNVIIFMLIGALSGLMLSYLIPPVYEAVSIITTNMEITPTGTVNELMYDSQINYISHLAYHLPVLEELFYLEAEKGHYLNNTEFVHEDTSVERELMNTVIKYRHTDPVIAARVVTTWGKLLYDALIKAYPHGVLVSEAKSQLDRIDSCVNCENTTLTTFCANLTEEDITRINEEAKQTILTETKLSLGLTREINISSYQPAFVPEKPLRFTRGSLILSGNFVGLLLAIAFNEFIPNRRK